jgi:hypothetical protein
MGASPILKRSQRPRMTHPLPKHHGLIRKIAFAAIDGGSGRQSPVKPTGDNPLEPSAGAPLPIEISASAATQMRQAPVSLAEGTAVWNL